MTFVGGVDELGKETRHDGNGEWVGRLAIGVLCKKHHYSVGEKLVISRLKVIFVIALVQVRWGPPFPTVIFDSFGHLIFSNT